MSMLATESRRMQASKNPRALIRRGHDTRRLKLPMPRHYTRGTSEERFWTKVEKTESCWNWTAGKNHYGYGSFAIRRGGIWFRAQAHRFAYELLVGPIPDGLTIDHLCRNPACVNPDHLEAVTRGENVLRGTGPSASHARKTHCPYGHPLSGDNLYIPPGRYARQCRACIRVRGKK